MRKRCVSPFTPDGSRETYCLQTSRDPRDQIEIVRCEHGRRPTGSRCKPNLRMISIPNSPVKAIVFPSGDQRGCCLLRRDLKSSSVRLPYQTPSRHQCFGFRRIPFRCDSNEGDAPAVRRPLRIAVIPIVPSVICFASPLFASTTHKCVCDRRTSLCH